MQTLWPVVVLCVVYAVLLVSQIGGAAGSLLSPTLDGIASLLSTPAGATVAWVHFLAFDLFVGRWAYLDSRERGISAWLVSPSAVLHFDGRAAGPAALPGRALVVAAPTWTELKQGDP